MGEPRWLDAEETRLWERYRELWHSLYGALNQQLVRDSGLSAAEYALLAPLSAAEDGVMRARELRAAAGWDRSRLAHQVRRLEDRGLVVREPCVEDARGSMVRLTAEGHRTVRAAAPEHVELVRRCFFDPLSREEITQLDTLLGRLLTAVGAATRAGPQPPRGGDPVPPAT